MVDLPSHNAAFCGPCFLRYFSGQVRAAVKAQAMFGPGERILAALSGGKDSLALANELLEQDCRVSGLFVDLAIPGSSDRARAAVEDFCRARGLDLVVVDLAAEGLAIPEVKRRVRRPVCSVCGKIKRHFFNRAAARGGFEVLATGHNLDDEAARLLANTLRWDGAYLSDQGPLLPAEDGFVRKAKPLYRLTEYETACYCFLKGIEVHDAPCPYSRGATFTSYKRLLDDLEHNSPGSKFAFYDGFLNRGRPAFEAQQAGLGQGLSPCPECGSPTSGDICGVCRIRRLLRGED